MTLDYDMFYGMSSVSCLFLQVIDFDGLVNFKGIIVANRGGNDFYLKG